MNQKTRAGRVGLVLGAGGAFAVVYHLGVLDGLRATGLLDPAAAVRVVGTSAGASAAAALAAGASSREVLDVLAAMAPRGLLREIGAMHAQAVTARHATAAALNLSAQDDIPVRRSRAGRLAGLFPGLLTTDSLMSLPAADGPTWDPRLWIPAVRVPDGATVVFGRDVLEATIREAVQASSAIPVVFQPKTIGGARYVDGALASPTHADLLLGDDIDLAVVSAPMLGSRRTLPRAWARRQLAAEVRRLRQAGTRVLILRPDAETLRAARGYPMAQREARWAIAAAAERGAVAAIARWADANAQDD